MHSGGFGMTQCIGNGFAIIVSTVEFESLLLGLSHCHWVQISCRHWSGHHCGNYPWSLYQPPFPCIEPLTLVWIPSPSLVLVNTSYESPHPHLGGTNVSCCIGIMLVIFMLHLWAVFVVVGLHALALGIVWGVATQSPLLCPNHCYGSYVIDGSNPICWHLGSAVGRRKKNDENEQQPKSLFVFVMYALCHPLLAPPPLMSHVVPSIKQWKWTTKYHGSFRYASAGPLIFCPPLVFLPTPHSSVENNSQPTSLRRGEGQKAGMLRWWWWMINHHCHCHCRSGPPLLVLPMQFLHRVMMGHPHTSGKRGSHVCILTFEGVEVLLDEPTSLNRGEGLVSLYLGVVGGEMQGWGQMWWWRKGREWVNINHWYGWWVIKTPLSLKDSVRYEHSWAW